jgi:hypothetical protein
MNIKFNLRTILAISALVWSVFLGLSVVFPPGTMFHILNPIAIATCVIMIMTYSPVIKDAWRNRTEGITPAHLLGFGITLNWVGLAIRMIRWYITGTEPSVTWDIEFWFYNFGLWISVWAGLFLYGAASLATKPRKISTLFSIFFLVVAVLAWWDWVT